MALTTSAVGSFAWEENGPSAPAVIRIWSPEQNASFPLVNLNPKVTDWRLGRQEVVQWKNQAGDQLEGILIYPTDYQEGRSYPLIVDAYPDTGNYFMGYPMGGNQAWASMGYAVFWPNVRAPHDWQNVFKSEAHDHAGKGPDGLAVMLDDLNSGIDELVRRGVADPTRMCLFGHSNGGAVVNQVVTMTNRFRCAVSVAAALSTDWSMPLFLNTDAKVIADLAGATPWEEPETYVKLSASYRLNKVSTPMLLAVGDKDGMILLTTIETYNGLRYLGKPVTFLRYRDQGHEFAGAALKDFWERETQFFDKYLKPESSVH